MIYVHRLMGDGAPGEADPKALSAASQSIYAKVVSDAERFAGPYKVKATLPDKLVAGQAAELTVEVLTAGGRRGARTSTSTCRRPAPTACRSPSRTGASGVGKAPITGTDPANGHQRSTATAASLPDVLPALFVPTKGQSARNAQRIVAGGDASSRRAKLAGAGPGAADARDPDQRADAPPPGAPITDTVNVTGLGRPDRDDPGRALRPVRRARPDHVHGHAGLDRHGRRRPATATTSPRRSQLDAPGYYTYRESIAESDTIAGRRDRVRGGRRDDDRPRHADDHDPDQRAGDRAGRADHRLGGRDRARQARARRSTSSCGARSRPARRSPARARRSGPARFPATGDGTYTTAPVDADGGRLLHVPRVDRGHRGATTPWSRACGEASETTIAKAAPQVTTVVSDAVVRPGGAALGHADGHRARQDARDGRGRAVRPVRVAGGHRLRGRAVLEGRRSSATGDGTYTSPKATVRRVGFYVFREQIAGDGDRRRPPGRVPGRGRDLAGRAVDPRRPRRQRRLRRPGRPAGRRG